MDHVVLILKTKKKKNVLGYESGQRYRRVPHGTRPDIVNVQYNLWKMYDRDLCVPEPLIVLVVLSS